ncbi:hypothetical protein B0H65DRAFT_506535 [Neurospora tetraspora]|uniref:Secreted protein n=1 Tax=Neurospora tetraspora TaxID=94610 RepID=A0AAE0JKF3_9PEZI|nr:hypothetical protein B0H65DRAFT_506535 [Neurospora tetraspora]
MTLVCQLLGLTSLAFLLFATIVAAEFTNSFTNLSYGSTVRLTWDATTAPIPPESYPLFITAQLIDKGENDGGDGNGGTVTAYRMNITAAVDFSSNNTFEWAGIPSPLRWLREGLYQVELHESADGTPLANSPFFTVGQPPYASGTEGGKPSTSSEDEVRFLFLRLAPYRRGNACAWSDLRSGLIETYRKACGS